MCDVNKIEAAIAKAEAQHPLTFDNTGGTWTQKNGETTGIGFVCGLGKKKIRQIWSRDIVQYATTYLGYKLAKVGEAHRLLRISTNEVDITQPPVARVQSLLEVLESSKRSTVKVSLRKGWMRYAKGQNLQEMSVVRG